MYLIGKGGAGRYLYLAILPKKQQRVRGYAGFFEYEYDYLWPLAITANLNFVDTINLNGSKLIRSGISNLDMAYCNFGQELPLGYTNDEWQKMTRSCHRHPCRNYTHLCEVIEHE